MRKSQVLGIGLIWGAGVTVIWILANPPAFSVWAGALGEALRSAGASSPLSVAAGQAALLWSVAVFLAANLGMAAAGAVFFRLAGPELLKPLARPARIAITLPLGWGLTGTALFGLGCCGLFRTGLLAVLLLAGAVLAWRMTGRTGRRKMREIRNFVPRTHPARLCAVLALVSLSVTAACALAPQTEIDSLIHNLPVAQRLLALGSFVPLPDNSAFHVSALSELLRAFVMGLGGEPAANLFNPLGIALTALLLASLLRTPAGEGWAWFAAAVYCANSFAFLAGQTSKPDLLLACPGLAVLALAGAGRLGYLAGAGLTLGAAAAMKYSAGLLAPGLAAILLFARRKNALYFLAAAALPVTPWLAKSWLLTGNPVFPFAYGVFGGIGLDAAAGEKMMWFAGNVLHADYYESWLRRLGALWTLTIKEGAPPVWLALLWLALAARGPRGAGLLWKAATLAFLALWTAGPIQFRYLAPILPAIIFLGVLGLAQSRRRSAVWLAGGLLLVQAVHLGLRPEAPDRILAGLGLEPREAYFRRSLPNYAEALERIGELPRRGRIICLGHAAAYPLAGVLLAPAVNRQFGAHAVLRSSKGLRDIRRGIRQINATHLLYNPPHAVYMRHLKSGSWDEREVGLWARFWRENAREIFRSSRISGRHGFFILYSLSPDASRPPSFSFLPGLEYGFASVEQLWMSGRYAQAEKLLQAIGEEAGDFGSFDFFKGHFLRIADPKTALELLVTAESKGYWDIVLWEDLQEIGRALERPGLVRNAQARLDSLVREK